MQRKHSHALKYEVLGNLESFVKDLIEKHESKRELWYSSQILPVDQNSNNDKEVKELRDRARGIPDSARVALALVLPKAIAYAIASSALERLRGRSLARARSRCKRAARDGTRFALTRSRSTIANGMKEDLCAPPRC